MQFGMYLYKRGVVDAHDLVHAYELQDERRVPLGVLAIEHDLLAVRDVLSVLRVQSDLPNDRFGEIAVDLGLMTNRDVAELLMIQSDRRPSMGECLVELGILTPEKAAKELAAFRRERERGGAGKVHRVISRMPNDAMAKAAELTTAT